MPLGTPVATDKSAMNMDPSAGDKAMTTGKPRGVVIGAVMAVVAFVVLYFGAPRALARLCAERAAGWQASGVVWECLAH